jgi:glutathione S-transferase
MSMADIPAGAMLHRYFTLEIDRPDLPHVAAWYARLSERPAYGEHVMVPYEDLRGRLAF